MQRRDFLGQLSALSAGVVAVPSLRRVASWRSASDPFTLGVASGDPWPDGFVLWTRLAPDPLNGGGMPAADVPVRFEIATDDQMRRIVRRGHVRATASFGHSVHLEVRGLLPDRWYHYRFMTPDAQTITGKARTAPAVHVMPERLRFAFASCQHHEWGHFTAHQHLADEDLDLVAFLGDYIYESPAGRKIRQHGTEEPRTLTQYRDRYALYKSDPHLQTAHARFPWLVTFDDHEVDNNWAGDVAEDDVPREAFLRRRAAAFQAWYEHMPLRRSAIPRGPDMLMYRRLSWGRLARLHALDTRQYRSDQACGDRRKAPCDGWDAASRTLLGAQQERWLSRALTARSATWQVLAQQVVMMPIDLDSGPGEMWNMDAWSGYPAARDRLTRVLATGRVPNVVTITGDVHTSIAGEIPLDHRRDNSPAVGVEYVGTSMTSDGDGSEVNPQLAAVLPANPWVKYHRNRRGYVRCEVTPDRWRSDYRLVPFVEQPGAAIATDSSFVTPADQSLVERA